VWQVRMESNSPVHRADARVKVTLTLAFILFLNMAPHQAWPIYILFLTVLLSMILLARMSIWRVIRRTLLVTPFILAAFPLIFSGPVPHLSISIFGSDVIKYSPEGLGRFISIAVKAWLSTSAAIMLTLTTSFPDILTALAYYGVPKLFIAILGLMWRYLFIINDEVLRMMRARDSRSAVTPCTQQVGGSLFWRARVTGSMVGSLLLRSLERSVRLYAAMLSRGYNGELFTLEANALSHTERRILSLGVLLLGVLWGMSLFIGD